MLRGLLGLLGLEASLAATRRLESPRYFAKEHEIVRNLLESRIGKEIDLQCEGATTSGKIVRIEGNILVLEKDDRQGYVNIERIVAFWDKPEKKLKSVGFLKPQI